MKQLLQKLFIWSTPAWRLATLFLWWAVFHFGWMVFLLWTNAEQMKSRLLTWIALEVFLGLLLLLTHLKGLAFRPLRSLRIFLWLISIVILGTWALLPILGASRTSVIFELEQPVHIGTSLLVFFLRQLVVDAFYAFDAWCDSVSAYKEVLVSVVGRMWLFCAFLAQVIADVLHAICEWRSSDGISRIRLRRSIVIGISFVLLPLASVACTVLLSHFLGKTCEAYGEELRKHQAAPSQMQSKAKLDDWDEFKKTEEKLEASWKAGTFLEGFDKWEGLKEETAGKYWLESRRLRQLPRLLREGIPDDASLCQRIQTALQDAEFAMMPLKREYILWDNDVRRQYLIESGPFGEDEFCVSPIIIAHFRHYRKPLSSVPCGIERLWRYLVLRRIDEFYQLKLKSLDTPMEAMVGLEAQFDRWLDSVPWNYEIFAPNTKCMDGVGVHISRYADLYERQDWQATCREAIVGIAMHQYRLRHGEWPATLERLEPSFLSKLPCDPFTNGPLKIAKHQIMPNALTVYSARKTGSDEPPDSNLCKGFPVMEK